MPEICRFYGIVVYMFRGDHPRPHIHVKFGEYKAVVYIETGLMDAGRIPPKQLRLVRRWIRENRDELLLNWKRAENFGSITKIRPLE